MENRLDCNVHEFCLNIFTVRGREGPKRYEKNRDENQPKLQVSRNVFRVVVERGPPARDLIRDRTRAFVAFLGQLIEILHVDRKVSTKEKRRVFFARQSPPPLEVSGTLVGS